MITIVCGTCGTSKGPKNSKSGVLSLPAAEEARLVKRGVAAYLTTPVINADDTPGNGSEDPGDGADGEGGAAGEGAGSQDHGGEDGGPERPEYNADMKLDELRTLLEEAGLPFRVGMKKSDMVDALNEFYGVESGEQPPSLEPEGPVL